MEIIKAYEVKLIGSCYSQDEHDRIFLRNTNNVASELKYTDLKLLSKSIDAVDIEFCGDLYEDIKTNKVYLCQIAKYNNPVANLFRKK